MRKIAVFASGTGTNAENLAKVFNNGSDIRVDLLIVDRKDAGALARLEALGVDCAYFPRKVWKEEPEKIIDLLRSHDIEAIALAGFLQVVGKEILDAYPGKILNLHPSLLPAYGGKGYWGHNVHEAVIANGDAKSGATVHVITPEIDRGPIVIQKSVDVEPGETPESLEQKVHQVEYEIYPEAVRILLEGKDAEPKADEYENEKEWAKALSINFKPSDKAVPRQETPVKEEERMAPDSEVRYLRHHDREKPTIPYVGKVQQPAEQEEESVPKMPGTYLWASIIVTVLFSMIPGIVAIIFSTMVSTKYYNRDYEGAVKASERAQIWVIVSIVVGVITNTIWLPFMLMSSSMQ